MSLKEWKNNEINRNLMKKWGLLKEEKMPMKPDVNDADGDGETDDRVPAFLEEDAGDTEKRHAERNVAADKKHIKDLEKDEKYEKEEEKLEEEQSVFAPNHYCVHHGGVQHEGQIKMAEAISHNFDRRLNKVTWYDMKLQDGTILEQVAAEDIQVTNASLAEMHHGHRSEDSKEDENEMEEAITPFTPGLGRKKKPSKAHQDEEGNRKASATSFVDGRTRTAAQTLKRRSGRGPEVAGHRLGGGTFGENTKISIKEAKEVTRRIIKRIQEDSD